MRSESGRRRFASPIKNSAQKPSQTHSSLIVLPPKAPAPPRAIDHATCGPVHSSSTTPVSSFTFPSTIWPAFPDHALTIHWSVARLYSASVCGLGG